MITNFLSPVSFLVSIERMPNTEFNTQRVNLPSLAMVAPEQQSPIHRIYRTPDRLEYSELDLSFIVDENMTNYREVLSWMEGLGTPESTDQRKALDQSKFGEVSDITIIIQNSARNPNLKLSFTDCMPIALSGVQLDVTGTDVIYPECTVTFRYTNMRLETFS